MGATTHTTQAWFIGGPLDRKGRTLAGRPLQVAVIRNVAWQWAILDGLEHPVPSHIRAYLRTDALFEGRVVYEYRPCS